MYLKNPFRLLGLPADADPADIRRRGEQLQLALAAGWSSAPGLQIPPELDRPAVLEAVRTLTNPQERLLHETFWLRCSPGCHLDLPDTLISAFPALSESEARALFQRYGGPLRKSGCEDASPAAAIQLAVMMHGVACHLEQEGFLVSADKSKRKLACDLWIVAVSAWQRVFASGALKVYLEDRIRALRNRGLSTSDASSLADRVGKMLAQVHGEILRGHWRSAANPSHQSAAVFHTRALLRMSKWLPPAKDEARRVLFDARDFVHKCVDEADAMARNLLPAQPERLAEHLSTLSSSERQHLSESLRRVLRGLIDQLRRPMALLVHTSDYTDIEVVKVGDDAVGLIRGLFAIAYSVSEDYPEIIELIDRTLGLPLDATSRHNLSEDRLRLAIAYAHKLADGGQWHICIAFVKEQLASARNEEERASWEREYRNFTAAKLSYEGKKSAEKGDLDHAVRAFETAQAYCDDPQAQRELGNAARHLKDARHQHKVQRIWRICKVAAAILVVGTIAILAWHDEASPPGRASSTEKMPGKNPSVEWTSPYTRNGGAFQPPGPLSTQPERGLPSQEPHRLGNDSEITRLAAEIKADKAALEQQEEYLNTNQGLVRIYRQRMDNFAQRISQYESNAKAGIRTDRKAYEADIESYNSLAQKHNSILQDSQRLYEQYQRRIQECNARVTKYNTMVGAK